MRKAGRINLKNISKSKQSFKQFLEQEIIRLAELELNKNFIQEPETPITPLASSDHFAGINDFSLYPPMNVAFLPFECADKIPEIKESEGFAGSEQGELSQIEIIGDAGVDSENLNALDPKSDLFVYENHFSAGNSGILERDESTLGVKNEDSFACRDQMLLGGDESPLEGSVTSEISSDKMDLCRNNEDGEVINSRRRRKGGIIPCCLG